MKTTNRRLISLFTIAVVFSVFTGAFYTAPAQAGKDDSQINSRDANIRAVNNALLKKYDAAFSQGRQSNNALTMKIVEWIYLRREPKKAGYTRLMSFIYANPTWPRRSEERRVGKEC